MGEKNWKYLLPPVPLMDGPVLERERERERVPTQIDLEVMEHEICRDLVEWLGPDTSTNVFLRLDDPADLVRLTCVSRSWRRFVIANGFCKRLCLRMCPEISNLIHVIEVSSLSKCIELGSSTSVEWESLKREHMTYAYFSHYIVSSIKWVCVLKPIGASSTDNYLVENIENTLEPRDNVILGPSYWSSDGESDPGVPETLTYRLSSKLWIVDEIKIKPFKAKFHRGYPIYSAETVQFRMGHSRNSQETRTDMTEEYAADRAADDNYLWSYVSPEFPMLQANILQSFKLPLPVVCMGGIVQIELMGRVQKCYIDGLYYICVSHVQVVGRPLSPVFDVDIFDRTRSSLP